MDYDLLYLMVLIDSHTISKSIDNDDKVDDIFDSITDLAHTRNFKLRRDRFLHKYRDYKDEYVKPVESLNNDKPIPQQEKATEKTTTTRTTTEHTTELHTKHHKSPKRRVGSFWRKFRGKDKKKQKENEVKERKRRISKNREHTWRLPAKEVKSTHSPINKNRRKNRKQFVLRGAEVNYEKRDVNPNLKRLFSSRDHKNKYGNKLQIGVTPHIDTPKQRPYKVKVQGAEPKTEKTSTTSSTTDTSPSDTTVAETSPLDTSSAETSTTPTENLNKLLASMTTQLTHLKQLYGLDKYNFSTYSIAPILDKSIQQINSQLHAAASNFKKTTPLATKPAPRDFAGTAQIEELLNDIKIKAIQMVAEQTPAITDIITNSVTEATFEADPILQHHDMKPGHYATSPLSLQDLDNAFNKRSTELKKSRFNFYFNNSSLISNTQRPHYLEARSIKEDTITMAHHVEEKLQKELKNLYNKMKKKVSGDLSKEVNKCKSTIKETIRKITSKISEKCKTTTVPATPAQKHKSKSTTYKHRKTSTAAITRPKETRTSTTAPRHTRGQKDTPMSSDLTRPTPTYDDYMMLSLYEQMLAKTHEDNVMKLLSTAETPVKKRKLKNVKLSKRNAETLADVKLKEDMQSIYEEGMNMPDYDYIEPSSGPDNTDSSSDNSDSSSNTMSSTIMSNDMSATPTSPIMISTQSGIEDTSYEGLSNKISYNDFVNGYRHYLKFQREQSQQNFSNLVKYQAHKHHRVDDIGKFILNKIPTVPVRGKRYFDDSDIEDQEISTKSDDSWFKKHFYLFIDNGPPKKFHTSQTVSLKSAVTEPEMKVLISADPIIRPGPKEQVFIKIGSDDTDTTAVTPAMLGHKDLGVMSLDDLSKILDSIKDKQSTNPYYRRLTSILKDTSPTVINATETSSMPLNLKLIQHNMGKWFGSNKRRATKKVIPQKSTDFNFDFALNMMTEFNKTFGNRYRRTASKEDVESTPSLDDFMNKELEEKSTKNSFLKKSTRETYADNIAVRSNTKETNKYGYVDIDLVPRQTAIVKLRENTSKPSRIREFFRKFHFKKKGKGKKKHGKRHVMYTRRPRFNPIKKLKDIFKVKSDDDRGMHATPNSGRFKLPNAPDYDMLTSRIDTFKPIKFDKPMSIEEMKKQIPNISDVVGFDTDMPKHSTKTTTVLYKLDESDRNLLSSEYVYTKLEKSFSPPMILAASQMETTSPTTARKATSTVVTKTTPRQTTTALKLPPTNVMTVNLKTMKTSRTPAPTTRGTKPERPTPLMTLDDMNTVLTKLQVQLSKAPTIQGKFSSPYRTKFSTPHHKRAYDRTNSRKPKQRIQIRRPVEELTIKSKLTRIAKFPISKRLYRNRDDYPRVHRYGDYMNFQDGPALLKDYWHEMRNRNAFNDKRKKGITLARRPNEMQKEGKKETEKCYTDYFNDLLMWHNDILNLDKVPSPSWKNILKNIEADEGYTTPNMHNLMKELDEINEFLDEGESPKGSNRFMVQTSSTPKSAGKAKLKSSAKSNKAPANASKKADQARSIEVEDARLPGIIRSFAMDDKTIVKSNDILIKGEAKYFQYNRPTASEREEEGDDTKKKIAPKVKMRNIKHYRRDQKKNKGNKQKEYKGIGFTLDYIANTNEPAILVDTTLLSYDDDVDSITRGIEVKKLSRNSQTSTKAGATKGFQHAPLLKTNKAPIQYYNTPLPMKPYDFEKFLKDNHMDVQSVTSPMIDLPTLAENWDKNDKTTTTTPHHTKSTTRTQTSTTTPPPSTTTTAATTTTTTTRRTTKVDTKPHFEDTTLKTKKIELTSSKYCKTDIRKIRTTVPSRSSKFTNRLLFRPRPIVRGTLYVSKIRRVTKKGTDRLKRQSELKLEPRNVAERALKNSQDSNYYTLLKKKMKLFDKKAGGPIPPHTHPLKAKPRPASTPAATLTESKLASDTFTVDPNNKDVEITIINFDDIEKLTTNFRSYDPYTLSSVRKDETASTASNDATEKTSATYSIASKGTTDPIHNELLYKDIFKEPVFTTTTSEYTSTDYGKNTIYVEETTPESTTAAYNKHYPFDFLNRLPHVKNMNMPQRVHISSHHYKYDIFYNTEQQKKYDDQKPTNPDSLPAHASPKLFINTAATAHMWRQTTRRRDSTIRRISNSSKVFRKADGISDPVRVIGRAHKKYRRAREATKPVVTETESYPGSLIFDLKHLRRSPVLANKERKRRLFKISANKKKPNRDILIVQKLMPTLLLQDKFKSLLKNSTTPTATTGNATSRVAKEHVRECNCSCRETTTPPAEKEGFRFTCTPSFCADQTESTTTPPTTARTTRTIKTTTEIPRPVEKDRCSVIICSDSPPSSQSPEPPPANPEPPHPCPPRPEPPPPPPPQYQEPPAQRPPCPEPPPAPCPDIPRPATKYTSTTQDPCKKHKAFQHPPDLPPDTLYMEQDTYNDQTYYEEGPMRPPPCPELTATSKAPVKLTATSNVPLTTQDITVKEHNDRKRDLQTQNTFTAKDVAALEVIVDLMKNTLSYEEKDIASVFNNNFMQQQHATKSVQSHNDSTNSIQVHIAIPFDFQNGKKRSPLDPVRVRKVFSARMSTPVDLEYQVHSFEGTVMTSSGPMNSGGASATNPFNEGLSPGMYLLVDKPRDGLALRPVKAKIDISDLKTRQAEVTASMTESKATTEVREETTSLKGLGKVTLSKDFIAAVNRQLLELYENMTKDNYKRHSRSIWVPFKMKDDEYIFDEKRYMFEDDRGFVRKRRIDWESVKKYFGHDRVCNCKCKPNKAMCRACAASDAVVDELIFEFDNLGDYMKDHCTEIQTYFWMNPSGGQKLRESVNRIDKSLGDYYKRVKGKCQGRTCKTFTTYIDKRQIVKTTKVPKLDVTSHFMNELSALAEDMNRTVDLGICFNHKLKEEGERFLASIHKCIAKKSANKRHLYKRSNTLSTKRKLIKNVYSLDNINVNIICNPEASTTTYFEPSTVSHAETAKVSDHLFDYEIENTKHKKRKGFKKLFPRKNRRDKLFTYYVASYTKKHKTHFKRDLDVIMPTPLIADGGGAFWLDYLKGTTNEPRIARQSNNTGSPKFGVAVVHDPHPSLNSVKSSGQTNVVRKIYPTVNTIYMTVKTSPKREITETTLEIPDYTFTEPPEFSPPSSQEQLESTTDYLTNNLNQLLQLFGSLQDIEAMNMHSNRSTMFLNQASTKTATKATKKKCTKFVKKIKTKMHYKDRPSNASEAVNTQPMNITTRPLVPSEPSNPADSMSSKITGSKLKPTTTATSSSERTSTESMAPADNARTTSPETSSPSPPAAADAPTPAPASDSPNVTPQKSTNVTTNITDSTSTPMTKQEKITQALEKKLKALSDSILKDAKSDQANAVMKKVTSPTKLTTSVSPKTSSILSDIIQETEPLFHEEATQLKSTSTSPTRTSNKATKQSTSTTASAATTTAMTMSTASTEGFLGKLKTATFKFFDNLGQKDDPEADFLNITSPTTTTKEDPVPPTNQVKYVTRISRLESETEMDLAEFDDSSQITTRMSPTIVIINQYDSQLSNDIMNDSVKVSDGYKNLLLSIIQYETNKLNDEWHKIAYGDEKDDNDVKRSISSDLKKNSSKTKLSRNPSIKEKKESHYIAMLEEPVDSTTKAPGLLNKLVSKIGMRGGKKKAGKKPNVREVTKKSKKPKNKKRKEKNRKVIPVTVEEACDSPRTSKSSQICDIQATYEKLLDLHKKSKQSIFENYVRNISCTKYKRVERSFYIPYKSQAKRWDWIRNKRSLKLRYSKINDDEDDNYVNDFDAAGYVGLDDDFDSFEKYVRGIDGIYKIIKRRKRTASLKALDIGLRNIPPLIPPQNELYAIVGDSVTFDCQAHDDKDKVYSWTADRKKMLEQDNVEVKGVKVTIKNVEPRNTGIYICSQDNAVQRSVRLNVMAIPSFDVVFLPVYKIQRECSYEDLKAIQRLGALMYKEVDCGRVCNVRIDEPVCQRDRGTNSSLIRTTAVISMAPRHVNCSVQCRRDLASSLVMLCASNSPALTAVAVVISKDGANDTLKPCKDVVRPVVTHTLRKKDSNGHHEYHKLVTTLTPGKVDVVLICPAGYYLIPEHKICASCPPNTSALIGDNLCRKCPRGTRAEPGASKCTLIGSQLRRYDWWWYPSCGYFVAFCFIACGCGVCVALAMLVHFVSRVEDMSCGEKRKPWKEQNVTAAYTSTTRRPLSPSRVILARFFKPSLTSSRATDSQETKFELWKERNLPPPLPPIDFDI